MAVRRVGRFDVDSDLAERLSTLRQSIGNRVVADAEDIAFVQRVEGLLGIARLANDQIDGPHIDDLLAAWRAGSKHTMRLLADAYEAEGNGDVGKALAILDEALQRIKMPFYAAVVEHERNEIAGRDSSNETT